MASRVIAKTAVFSVCLGKGKEFVKVNRGGESVMAILVNAKDEVYFVKKTSPSSRKTYLTLPGGMIERGEAPTLALKREVFEEVGLTVSRAKYLTTLEILPGYLVGKTHLYHCAVNRSPTKVIDEKEISGIVAVNLAAAFGKVKEGEITDSRTVAALLFFHNFPLYS